MQILLHISDAPPPTTTTTAAYINVCQLHAQVQPAIKVGEEEGQAAAVFDRTVAQNSPQGWKSAAVCVTHLSSTDRDICPGSSCCQERYIPAATN